MAIETIGKLILKAWNKNENSCLRTFAIFNSFQVQTGGQSRVKGMNQSKVNEKGKIKLP